MVREKVNQYIKDILAIAISIIAILTVAFNIGSYFVKKFNTVNLSAGCVEQLQAADKSMDKRITDLKECEIKNEERYISIDNSLKDQKQTLDKLVAIHMR